MRRQGFTLVELLAVIVILAIIALIATPTILGVIETARKGAAESSALGYMDAIEKQLIINIVDNTKDPIKDGIYILPISGVTVKGQAPKGGWVEVKNGVVSSYHYMTDEYSIEYDSTTQKQITENLNNISYPKIIFFDDNYIFGSTVIIESSKNNISKWRILSSNEVSVKLLSEYNLSSETNYMSQDLTNAVNAIAFNENSSNLWEESQIKPIVENYGNSLNLADKLISSQLITKEELMEIGCDNVNNICSEEIPNWIYSTDYWTMTSWDGRPNNVWKMKTSRNFSVSVANTANELGIRPVITIEK